MSTGADGITQELEQLGPYLLVDRIGEGGMAEGFRVVRADGPPQKLFLKRILPQHRSAPDYLGWFLREGAIVASLRHANIVTLTDPDPEGRYLVFELIDGVNLHQLLRSQPDQRLPVPHTTLILLEVLKGLAHAHARTSGGKPAGVIHRDLDPSNVLISYAGEVKIADFGVSAIIRADGQPMTTVAGKDPYRSPEETRNEEEIDGRSDIFSLGVMAYEMLAGERPYTGTRSEIARAIAAGRRIPLRQAAPEVPAPLAEVIERMLNPVPNERFASAPECQYAIYRAHAPDQMLYLELGHMALRARPHQTLEPSQLRPLIASAAQPSSPAEPRTTRVRNAVDQVVTVPMPSELTKTHARSSQLEDSAPAPRAAIIDDVPTNPRARRGGIRTTAAFGFGIGIVAAGILATHHVITPKTNNSGEKLAPNDIPQPPPIEPQPTTQPPTPPAPAKSSEPGAVVEQISTPTPREEGGPPNPAPEPGTLFIGALPQAQVWVDGQYVGWSYVKLRIAPGQHTVSIGKDGREQPNTRRTVTVTSGRQRTVAY